MNERSIINPGQLIPGITEYNNHNFFLLAGPCVVESRELALQTASHIKALCQELEIPFVYKSSYKKANRSSLSSFTGIGDREALEILAEVKSDFDIPVITDIHSVEEAELAADYVDVLQIPAFLSRQTDLLIAAGNTGRTVSIKKGQFLSPGAMKFALDKVKSTGNEKVFLTERGSMFGYQDLVVDFRGIPEMRSFKVPVVLDVTHSLQQPNQEAGVTGGQPHLIETIAKAGIAAGADGIFLETHPDPSQAKSDGANMLPLDQLEALLVKLNALRKTILEF